MLDIMREKENLLPLPGIKMATQFHFFTSTKGEFLVV